MTPDMETEENGTPREEKETFHKCHAPRNKARTQTLRGGEEIEEMKKEIEILNYKSKPNLKTLINKLKARDRIYR